MVSYEPLFKTMEKKEISTYKLIKNGIDKKTIYRLKHGENVTINMLEKICRILDCEIEDVVKIIKDK